MTMEIYRSNWLLRVLCPAVYLVRTSGEKQVCLTFDDGPCLESTAAILDILRRTGVEATFFCVGENVERYGGLFADIRELGHAVGNHTMHHLKGWNTGFDRYIADVEAADRLINSRLIRPPYGKIGWRQRLRLKRMGYRVVMWDVIAYDWDSMRTPEQVLDIVMQNVRNGSVIVLHDSKKAAPRTPVMLEELIVRLKAAGYGFKLLE